MKPDLQRSLASMRGVRWPALALAGTAATFALAVGLAGPEARAQSDCAIDVGAEADISPEQAEEAYQCMMDQMAEAYGAADNEIAQNYQDWERFNTLAYKSATHGGRWVNNYAGSEAAEVYGNWENIEDFPVGGQLAKDSMVFQEDGSVAVGPLFLMTKLEEGASEGTGDWEYQLVTPAGQVNEGEGLQFCADCHMNTSQTDSLLFVPEDLRVEGN